MQKPSDEMGVRVLQEQEQTKEQQKLLSEVLGRGISRNTCGDSRWFDKIMKKLMILIEIK